MGQLYNLDAHPVLEEMPVRTNKRSCVVASEDKKLELRLGPPGDQDQSALLPQLGFISSDHESKRVCHQLQVKAKNEETKWLANTAQHQPKSSYFQCPMIPHPDKKACSDPASVSKFTNSAAAISSDQKSKSRIAQAPVVGWPPIRSCRKNLANKSSLVKPASESPLETLQEKSKGKSADSNTKDHMFVKINMEGVPIGRKVNLKAYDSYEKLSSAIDQLFQGLLAAQRDYSAVEKENKEETKAISDSYTLLYEDNEGDRMLVGDVPWNMFVSTAKRLRVLKSSELSTLRLSSSRPEKTPLDSAMEIGS